MPCLDLVSMGWVFGREKEVDGTTGVGDSIVNSVAARDGDSTGPEEGTRLEEGKVTSTEVAGTLEDSLGTGKEEPTEGKASEIVDKEEVEESEKRVEIQRSKGGLSEEDVLEVGRVGNLDSLKIT